MENIRIDTPIGTLVVSESTDPGHPGVWVDLRREGFDYDMSLALVEYTNDDNDPEMPEGGALVTRVWGHGECEDPTFRVVHKGIEEYFEVV